MKRSNVDSSLLPSIPLNVNNGATLTSSSYTKMLEIYYTFAYYMCCVPYRFKRKDNGQYFLHQWWPQKVLYYIFSSFYIYYTVHRTYERWYDLYIQSRTQTANPLLYVRIMEASAYANYTFAVVCAQSFKGRTFLKFLNMIFAYTNTYPCHRASTGWRKIIFSTYFLLPCTAIITAIALLNFFIYYNMQLNFSEILNQAYSIFLWVTADSESSSSDRTGPSYIQIFLVVIRIALEILGNLRDTYGDFFFLVGIITLWVISCDFCATLQRESTLVSSIGCWKTKYSQIKSVTQYHRISKLSRCFSLGHGYPLLSYLLLYLLYYAIGLDRLFQKSLTFGEKFYDMEFLLTLVGIFGLGAFFSHKMCSLKKLINLQSIAPKFNHNQFNMISYWYIRDLAAIRASTLPITVNTLIQFVGQIMVIFLICVQSKLSSTSPVTEVIY